MILESKKTTVAYRCPACGGGVMSVVGLFDLTAEMVKLKCSCKQSEMIVNYTKDKKVRFTVPCITCPTPHRFLVNSSVFFGRDLFAIPCPYTGISALITGDTNSVKAELARGELELLDLLEKSGMVKLDELRSGEAEGIDPQIGEVILYAIKELDEEGRIYCACESRESGRIELEFLDDGVCVRCANCGASKVIGATSLIAAQDFLSCDELHLQ